MQPCKSFFLILKFLVLLVTNIEGIDVFCGQLEIFNEQRFGQGAITVSSQTTTDMKQCLDVCCSIPTKASLPRVVCPIRTTSRIVPCAGNAQQLLLRMCVCVLREHGDSVAVNPHCDGVTFEGITSTDFDDSNCLLVSCEPECQFNGPSTQHSSGVLSVLIHRIRNETTTPPTPSTTKSSYIPEIRAALTPFWVLAVAIGVAAICVGLNVTLCVAYCCYCRRKKRSQKAHISTVKGGPTLHAFNPQV
eukprot:NP_001021768.1 Uncharacterized protein CELE_Y47G6A.32 [Caenorhabditis elegans]